MNVIFEQKISSKIFLFCLSVLFIFSSAHEVSATVVSSYTFNGKSESVSFNPNSDKISISLSTSIPVKFSTLAICSVSDVSCSRSTAVKYFTQTNVFSTNLSKEWDGKTGGTSPSIVSDGEYRLKLTSKDENNNDVTEELSPFVIHVSSSVPVVDDPNLDTYQTASTTSTTTAQTPSNDVSSKGVTYVYSSSAPLSTYNPISLNVDAGRERIAFLHSPTEFKSRAVDKNSGKDISGARYMWTFGDGSSEEGSDVSHVYTFPGDYIVVLNSSSGDEEAVDVTKIKVVEPKVQVVYADSYIEFTNQNSMDINIGGWKLKNENVEYQIPRDTIVFGNGSIKIPRKVLGRAGESASLFVVYPDGQDVVRLSRVEGVSTQETVARLHVQLTKLQQELSQMYADSDHTSPKVEARSFLEGESDKEEGGGFEKEEESVSVAAPIESPASRSLMSKFVDFFGTIFR